ncbi:hypothetical protein LSM04_000284 [Trypanosoma melophagium]|uniref:uncharacterized protein n=1 Tax=Trypanosoma melophagium TaxID=715481 RepID=UPI00351A9883|nr:hypothetical protein LSM04_000284 [Trypanosoma melophagium]
MKNPHGRCFLVQFSAFAASHIDASIYPPPYFLRGTFCNSSMESSLSSVEGTPSWELCHRFEFKEIHNVMDQQMVIECYSTDETNFIGICRILPDQLLQLVESSSSSSCVVNNFPLTLQLYNGAQVEGTLSFHVTIEKIILLTLIITRMALIPHPLPGSSLCVEISCGYEEIGSDSSSVRSEYVPREISEWTGIPHLHCKTTLTALEKDGLSLVFMDETGEVMTHLRIAVPIRIPTSSSTIITSVSDMERCGLNVDMPVEFVGMDAKLHCILTGETVAIEPHWKSQSSVVVSCDVMKKEEKDKEKDQNKWKNDGNKGDRTSSSAVSHMPLTEDLCILGEVLQRQEKMLVMIHERLEFVRKSKAEVLSKLESLRHMAEAAAKDPNVLTRNIEIESELHACMRKRRRLKSELALVQQQYAVAALNHARRSERRTQELEKLKIEHRAVSHLREYTQRVQERMVQDGLSEQKRREERQEQAKEEESLICNDAETLAVVERLLRELQL